MVAQIAGEMVLPFQSNSGPWHPYKHLICPTSAMGLNQTPRCECFCQNGQSWTTCTRTDLHEHLLGGTVLGVPLKPIDLGGIHITSKYLHRLLGIPTGEAALGRAPASWPTEWGACALPRHHSKVCGSAGRGLVVSDGCRLQLRTLLLPVSDWKAKTLTGQLWPPLWSRLSLLFLNRRFPPAKLAACKNVSVFQFFHS